MRIKTGDKVIVIAGKNRGQGQEQVTGKVLSVDHKNETVIVEGVNLGTFHIKPRSMQDPGGLIQRERPIHVSNVMYYDEKTKSGSRIGYKIVDGKKVRYSKKSGEVIDK